MVLDCPKRQAFTFAEGENMEDAKRSTNSLSSASDTGNSIFHQRPPRKRSVSQLIKAVVFEIIFVKRVRSGKAIDQGSYHQPRPDFQLRTSREKFLASVNEIQEDKPSLGPSSSSSSSSPSFDSSCNSCSNSRQESKKKQRLQQQHKKNNIKQSERKAKGKDEGQTISNSSNSTSLNHAMCLLLLSMAVTIFWGKICAVLFTSIWLYFLPQRPTTNIGRVENVKRMAETEPRDYRTKVIMEGFLERNHHSRDGIKMFT